MTKLPGREQATGFLAGKAIQTATSLFLRKFGFNKNWQVF